jgi:hypothetical protein
MGKHRRAWLSTLALCAVLSVRSAAAPSTAIEIVPDDIGGIVKSANGPEAGVWVIAETTDLPTKFVKIVVTDDQGRYVVPELPKAKYKIWVRGYGLVDSKPVESEPGMRLDLTAVVAPDPKAAAEYYPANYWLALMRPPAADEFPGTGSQGNGISPALTTQQQWLAHFKENCTPCHQFGDRATRELAGNGGIEGWAERIKMARAKGDVTEGNRADEFSANMQNDMARFGRERGLKMFADWSDRIAKGEIPPEAPPRPTGVERNLVISEWDWAGGHFVHDLIASDKRDPNVSANGTIFGVDNINHNLIFLDPKTAQISQMHVPDDAQGVPFAVHTPTEDKKGRVWISITEFGEGDDPPYCTDGSLSKYAKYFPNGRKLGRHIVLFEPDTKKLTMIPVCWGNLHLKFTTDKDDTLYFSGDANVMGWINTRIWDETHDAAKAVGWCPMVLDTNGDGKITPDSTQWNQPGDWMTAVQGEQGGVKKDAARPGAASGPDPTKDTRISGFLYGMSVDPKTNISWYAKFTPYVPSGLIRLDPGSNPPETCRTEYYEPPKLPNGEYAAFNARAVDVDDDGVAWVDFGSGHLGRFDRRKCRVLNGPTATGQHCPEGWTIYLSPGPKITGTNAGADWHYLMFMDQFDVLGLGKDIPITPGTNSDSLLALMPDSGKWVVMRVPYPMGFYSRGMDERIDDPKAGWKGRGLWSNYAEVPLWHIEGGEGTMGKAVKFQLRPDPLAH